MTIIDTQCILSVSSEDPAFPAKNLLKQDNKKWKCKVGEKQASVILQLKQETLIDKLDIGNEHSAFVEVLVGKSSSQNNEFKVLLVASSLMTLKESKDGTNASSVRFFKKSDFTQTTADEKWDKVKIVCTQPFNKHVQYGLSFVVFHSPNDESGDSETSLGRFTLKEEDNDQPVSIGSWFAKRKDPPVPVPPGAAAAIRDASSPAGIAQGKLKKQTPRRPKNTTPTNGLSKQKKGNDSKTPSLKQKKDNDSKTPTPKPQTLQTRFNIGDDEDSPADDTDADSTYSPTKDSASVLSDDDVIPQDSDDEEGKPKKNKRPKRANDGTQNGKILNGYASKRKHDDVDMKKAAKLAKLDRETKPFARLLEGVTIVISGYQNPLRGELRSKACAMGAKYKGDWDNTCTHLICAFVNTPKFCQVRGRGKIVKKEWIEECHNRHRRLPWRRFALDRNDIGTSSEEEVWEEVQVPTTSNANMTVTSRVNRERESSGSDTEEEIERVRARQSIKKPTTTIKKEKETLGKAAQPNKTAVQADPFADDTDVDSESESQTANLPLPPLPDFFDSIIFHIAGDIVGEERSKLHRYITAYKGSLVDDVDGSVEYAITKSSDIAAEISEEFGINVVSPDWIWECSDSEHLIPVTNFLL